MRIRRLLVAMIGVAAAAITGCGSSPSTPRSAPGGPAESTQLTVLAHRTDLEFVTAAGATTRYPSGPLAVGDRVLGRDDILGANGPVGADYETCTVSFGLHVLCEDTMSLTGKGDLHVTWLFQWPASSTTGPSSFNGIVDGGTAAYRNARGDFQAIALANGDLSITARLTH